MRNILFSVSCLLAVASNAAALVYSITNDHADLLYRVGERATFQVSVAEKDGKVPTSGVVHAKLDNSGTPDRRATAEKWAPYFDGANFASRITCPVRVAVGFADTTCAPCAVYAAYNEIKVKDKDIVHGFGMSHSCFGKFYESLGAWVRQ